MSYRTIHLRAGERQNRKGKTKSVAACGTLVGENSAGKLRPTLEGVTCAGCRRVARPRS